MRQPAPRQPRRFRSPGLTAAGAVAVALAATVTACADDGPGADPRVVAVLAQHCATPTRSRGVGTVIAPGLVVTAGHVVAGELRDLRVDGRHARVAALDRRADLALVAVDLDGAEPARLAPSIPDEALLTTPAASTVVHVDRHVILVVDDAVERTSHRRDVVAFTPAVERGASGSPLLDSAGRLVGVVITSADVDRDGTDDESYAVTAAEVRALVARGADGSSAAAAGGCDGR